MRARRTAACLLAVAALGIGAVGCGDDEEAAAPPTTEAPTTTAAPPTDTAGTQTERIEGVDDAAAGKVVFTQNCAGCHTLADAGATGTVGPNLDDLKPDYSIVGSQVQYGGGGMPSFDGKITDQDIADVAKYVSEVAGK